MFGFLRPSPTLSERDVQRGQFMMRWEGVLSGALFSLGSGGFMAAYALALGANNLQVGILAALPFVFQVLQLPSILVIERFRTRKAIGLPAWFVAQLMWLPIGAVPFLLETPGAAAVSAVIALMAIRGLFTGIWTTSMNSWLRDLVPRELLGSYFGRRLALMTIAIAAVGLGGSFFVQWWEGMAAPDSAIFAYSFLLIGGWVFFGVSGPSLLAAAREPLMPAAQERSQSAISILLEPIRDPNYFRFVRYLVIFNFALTMAVPFFAVYMLTRLGFSLPTVIGFTILSQVTNVLFVRVWGAMADRTGSKTVLSLASSLYLLVIIGWVFTTNPDRYFLTVPLLVALHFFAGIAGAGVLLTIQTLTLKAAPEGRATPYLGVAGMATGLGAGIGPVAGGALADFFSVRTFRIDLSWSSPNGIFDLPAVTLSGFDFLFAIAFILGLLSLNLLTAFREEGEVDRETALNELMAGMSSVTRPVSSVPAVGAVSAASYGYVKRIPGADVALGVTAYQLAASAQTAVASIRRGRNVTEEVQSRVRDSLTEAAERMDDVGDHGLELARQVTRGAVHAGNEIEERTESVARAAAIGVIRALGRLPVLPRDAVRGAAYGTVEGALESGSAPAEMISVIFEAARETATDLGMTEDEATLAATGGIISASAAAGQEALDAVLEVLPDELRDSYERDLLGENGAG